jgi:hydrogenase expression/formation protein HypE
MIWRWAARPLYLSAGFILEEGFPVADLRKIVASMQAAAASCGVQIATGDTKVVQKGKGDGCYINTSGVGVIERPGQLSAAKCQPGDVVILSGPIGEHGITIMLARGELEIEADIESDTAPLSNLVERLLDATNEVRCMRDATRGGVATVLNEIAAASGVGIVIEESRVPLKEEVAGACEILGIDPLHVACEGRLVAIVSEESAARALEAIRGAPGGAGAKIVGQVNADPPGIVLLKTSRRHPHPGFADWGSIAANLLRCVFFGARGALCVWEFRAAFRVSIPGIRIWRRSRLPASRARSMLAFLKSRRTPAIGCLFSPGSRSKKLVSKPPQGN